MEVEHHRQRRIGIDGHVDMRGAKDVEIFLLYFALSAFSWMEVYPGHFRTAIDLGYHPHLRFRSGSVSDYRADVNTTGADCTTEHTRDGSLVEASRESGYTCMGRRGRDSCLLFVMLPCVSTIRNRCRYSILLLGTA